MLLTQDEYQKPLSGPAPTRDQKDLPESTMAKTIVGSEGAKTLTTPADALPRHNEGLLRPHTDRETSPGR